MANITIGIKSTPIDVVQVKASHRCTNCGSELRNVTTNYVIVASIVYSKSTHVVVTCADCGKKVNKRVWDENITAIVAEKKDKFRTTFFQKYGTSVIGMLVVLIGGFILIYSGNKEHQEIVRAGQENFAKASATIQQEWYDNIANGDYLLVSKGFNDPARVFFVKESGNDNTVLVAYDQYIDRNQYEDLAILNSLELGKGDSEEVLVKTSNIRRGIIEKISDNPMAVPDGYIQQIKKGS